MIQERPAWQRYGACVGLDPALFYPGRGESNAAAVDVCNRCHVRSACLEYALTNREGFGIWGGTSERERRNMRSRKVAACGTRSGYMRHRRLGEEPCKPCREADQAWHRYRRAS